MLENVKLNKSLQMCHILYLFCRSAKMVKRKAQTAVEAAPEVKRKPNGVAKHAKETVKETVKETATDKGKGDFVHNIRTTCVLRLIEG